MIERLKRRWVLTAIVGVLGGIAYLSANSFASAAGARDISSELEKQIPFIPEFIYAYLLIFPFLSLPLFTVKKDRDFFYVIVSYFVLVAVSVAIFMTVRTKMARPEINITGVTGWLFKVMRTIDGPNNLFPSLHVSSVVFVALINGYFCPRSKGISWILAVLICASTLFVKQHVVADVLGGVVLGASVYILLRVLRRRG